jgi:hypothetical protein
LETNPLHRPVATVRSALVPEVPGQRVLTNVDVARGVTDDGDLVATLLFAQECKKQRRLAAVVFIEAALQTPPDYP